MKLEEALKRFNSIAGVKFGELFPSNEIREMSLNKGRVGQLLELSLGMSLSNSNLDFEDGELKTSKSDSTGTPKGTVFITQISGAFDEFIQEKPFEQTHLYEKIRNILYVPVCKDGKPEDWMFLPSTHIDLSKKRFSPLKDVWREDYYSICKQLKSYVEDSSDGFIHTSNGKYLQVRSKDYRDKSGYHPIFSQVYNRPVSNKNHAFYFKKQCLNDIRQLGA